MMAARTYRDLALWRRLALFLRPYAPHCLALGLLSLAATPLALLAPLPLKIAVDSLAGGEALPAFLRPLFFGVDVSGTTALALAATLSVVVALVRNCQEFAVSWLGTYLGERLALDVRSRLFRHAQQVALGYHDTNGTADSVYRIQYDAAAVPHVVLDGLLPLTTNAVTLVVMVVVAAQIDLQLVVLAALAGPALILVNQCFKARFRRQWVAVKSLEAAMLSVVQEVLSAARLVKAFGQEEREHARFVRHARATLAARLRTAVSEGAFGFFVVLTTRGAAAAVLFLAALKVQSGALSLGDLVLLVAYMTQVFTPLRSVGQTVAGLQGALASAQRVFALLDEETGVADRPDARPLVRARGGVTFQNVSFGYQGDHPALQDVSFTAPPGTGVAVVGRTGAGKTTLVNLVIRFYDPRRGRILLDGVDLRDYRLADLRNQFAVVLQEPVLFPTSIAENIAYARPDASEGEVVAAARSAGAHDFITALPAGYATPVGERGACLSGGERQRIALARAFLKDAPILILDEPTSSVDARTEAGIVEALERLMHGRTTFLISHRPSTLEKCDLVLELDRGRLVAETAAACGAGSGALDNGRHPPAGPATH
jgi:ATP-binding cassette subfamily B protein